MLPLLAGIRWNCFHRLQTAKCRVPSCRPTLARSLGCAVLTLAAGFTASAQPMTKEQRGVVEGYGATFVRAINASAAEIHRATIQQVFIEKTVQELGPRIEAQFARLNRDYAPLEYHHSEVTEHARGSMTSRVLHVYAKARGATAWKDFQFMLEANPPYRIMQLAFIADVAEPVYLPNGDFADASTQSWLNNYISKLMTENGLSGTVLVTTGAQTVFERHFGFADLRGTQPITADTGFNLGSGNKMMTAVAIAQLVEKGVISYTDSISKFFPDFPNAAHAQKTTIHHLLSHTSGIGEYWTKEYEQHWESIRTMNDMLPWVYKAGVNFAPGSEHRYSNSNFVLAGLIIEKVSKSSYFDYVKKNIYEPLGMKATDHHLLDGSVKGLAERLRRKGDGWEVAPHGYRGSAAGGGFSTPRDMDKFIRGLMQGKILSANGVKTLTTSKTTGLEGMDYGYGFILSRSGQTPYLGHGGTASGVNFELAYFPNLDTTLVIFSNQDNGAYDDLKRNIIKLISGYR